MTVNVLLIDDGKVASLNQTINSIQPNLSDCLVRIGDFVLLQNFNQEADWQTLFAALELNGFQVLLVFIPNRSGSDEVLAPTNEGQCNEGAAKLDWFKQKQREIAREEARIKQAQKPQRKKWKPKLFKSPKAGRK